MKERHSILFLTRNLDHLGVTRDDTGLGVRDTVRRQDEHILEILKEFGVVNEAKTSGFFPTVDTPPEGLKIQQVDGKVLVEDPQRHPSTAAAFALRQRNASKIKELLLSQIKRCTHVVATVDGESETRGSLIWHAHCSRKPIVLLQKEVKLILSTRPLYHNEEGINYVVYEDFELVARGDRPRHDGYRRVMEVLKNFFHTDPAP